MQTDMPTWMEPLPASLLLDREIARKEALAGKGNVMTGCPELDEYVLLGGLERGSVVGVSAEEEEMSMLVGFQTLARLVATEPTANVRVVTTLSMTELVSRLKQALVGQLSGLDGGVEGLKGKVQACFARISISRVFDVEGLLEVLDELGQGSPSAADTGKKGDESPGEQVEGQRQPRIGGQDIGSTTNPSPPQPQPAPQSTLPDLILITHISSLLSTLFTGRDKDTAHNTAVLLGSHLRTLSHSPAPGGPLIILLNTTTSSSFSPASHNTNSNNNTDDPGPIPRTDGRERPTPSTKHPNPTLRSIFNPLPSQSHGSFIHDDPSAAATAGPTEGPPTTEAAPAAAAAVSRNKPSFGLVFTQLLDVHLLCTRVLRTRKDREAIVAATAAAGTDVFNPGMKPGGVSYVWVVEVLLDEVGVYEGVRAQGQPGGEDGDWGWEGRKRRSREQRWGVVDVDGLGRVVDVVW